MDPLTEIYSDMSPYNYAANNPILFVDYDGQDYGVYVDEENNTITIKATLYTASDDVTSAKNAAKSWNDQSGENTYTTGKDDDAKTYTINFEVSVVEVEIKDGEKDHSLEMARSGDLSGEANTYNVKKDSDFSENKNGRTPNGNDAYVKDSKRDGQTGAHEVGHILGAVHSKKGLMTESSSSSKRTSSPTSESISQSINAARKGKPTQVWENGKVVGIAGKPTLNGDLKKGKVNYN